MKFREISRTEIEYRLRSPSTWLYAAILFFLPFMMVATGSEDGPLTVNAPKTTMSAEVGRTGAGEYVVTMVVTAKKLRADRVGNETEVPMNDFVEIGVFETVEAEPFYLQRHRIRNGEQTIRVTVRRQPARAGIDP